MRTSILLTLASLFVALSLAACGGDMHPSTDAGPDARVGDGSVGEGGTDAGMTPDAGSDLGVDLGSDGGVMGDAGVDATMGDAGPTCPEADLAMMVGVSVRTGTTVGATAMFMPSCTTGDSSAPGTRFSWTAPTSGMYTFDTLGSDYDTMLALLDGTCTGTELECNDDASGTTSRIDTTVTAGHVYVIVVTGFADGGTAEMGNFVLSITQPPADETGVCRDGLDNDRDGDTDCADFDCVADPMCSEMNCTNGVDDDTNGDTDCADSDCSGLPICVAPNCGNGAIDAGETCDDDNGADGDGCSAFCQVEPLFACTGTPSVCATTCGNGAIDTAAGEECDDGNTTDGDRCSALCALESTEDEAESNDTVALATTVGDGERVRGTIDSTTDIDVFTFTITAPTQVDLETYTTIDGNLTNYDGTGTLGPRVDCPTDDTAVHLFAATGDVTDDTTALAGDDNNGDGACSFLGAADSSAVYLAPGTYYIKVAATGGAMVPLYILDVRFTSAVAPAVGGLVINEFMANPSTLADTNCDGVIDSGDDEFVELVNTTATFLDLTGITISDQMTTPTVRHTFGARGLAPHAAIVVYGGGIAACTGVNGDIATAMPGATAHTLSLNNTNDGITITGAVGVIASAMYATSVAGVSANLSPDLNDTVAGTDTGPYVRHNLVPGAVGSFSPGKRVDGTAF